jgi:hypothetical protein
LVVLDFELRGLLFARQALYHLIYASSPHYIFLNKCGVP